jgi:hypothetical protein
MVNLFQRSAGPGDSSVITMELGFGNTKDAYISGAKHSNMHPLPPQQGPTFLKHQFEIVSGRLTSFQANGRIVDR